MCILYCESTLTYGVLIFFVNGFTKINKCCPISDMERFHCRFDYMDKVIYKPTNYELNTYFLVQLLTGFYTFNLKKNLNCMTVNLVILIKISFVP